MWWFKVARNLAILFVKAPSVEDAEAKISYFEGQMFGGSGGYKDREEAEKASKVAVGSITAKP